MTTSSRRRALFLVHFSAAFLISQASYSQHLPEVPDSITAPGQRADYIVEHYWDNMSGSLLAGTEPETDEQVIADFLLLEAMADKRIARDSFASLLDRISGDGSKEQNLLDILFKYLYGTDSPYRNDALCGERLGMMLSSFQSPLLKAKVSFCLDLAENCKPGTRAKDFRYITADGRTGNLYDNSGSLLLLVFYSPGCRDCNDFENRLNRSDTVRTATRNGLRILFVCPDGYVEHRNDDRMSFPDIEKAFACDDSIISEGKYMYRSIPSAYLLDRNLDILLKEPSFTDLETYLSGLFSGE